MGESFTQLDPATSILLAQADAEEAAKPDEPSLPFDEWLNKNLFTSVLNTVWTMLFGLIGLTVLRGLVNFIFGAEQRWDAVRVNLRLLFTQAYPADRYARVFVAIGFIAVLAGISLGLARVGAGISMKRISMWFISAGGFVVVSLLLRKPTSGATMYSVWVILVFGAALIVGAVHKRPTTFLVSTAGLGLGFLFIRQILDLFFGGGSSTNDAPDEAAEAIEVAITDSSMIDGRGWWWIFGLLLLGAGLATWIALGDLRRRTTFVPTIPFGLVVVGVFVSTTWWLPWGHYGFNSETQELFFNPGERVAASTRNPWTLVFLALVAAYVISRRISKHGAAGRVRGLTNVLWMLSPFITFWGILRGPVVDWDHLWSTDLPMLLAFALGGAVLLWILTEHRVGEIGRIIAALIVLLAFGTWIDAFFGWHSMLQKARLSLLLLGLAALLAPTFKGEAKQRLRLVYGWIGFMVVFHILVTLMNSDSSIEVPSEDFAGGFMISIYVSVFTMIFSFPLGVLLALARTSKLPLFRVMATVYIEAIRGVPLITMLFFFSVFVNLFLPPGMELSSLAAVTIAFSLFGAAYTAENVRGGLQAVRQGQYEASDALGLTTVQRTLFIVLPQALRVSIPPLVGGMIATFKETSLLAIVGIFDFLRIARDIIPAQTEFLGVKLEGLLFISAVYWIGAYSMSKYSQRLERQLGVGER